MIKGLTAAAYRIDTWLHAHLGLKYGVLLTVGLIIDIGRRALDAPKQIAAPHHLVGTALSILLECGLLIHQVAELYERLGFREQPGPVDNGRV